MRRPFARPRRRADPKPTQMHGESAEWPLTQSPHQGVYVTGPVAERHLPVLCVVHDRDGDLQFLDAVHDVDYSTSQLLCLHDAVALDPSLMEVVRELPQGWAADRDDEDGPWVLSLLDSRDG